MKQRTTEWLNKNEVNTDYHDRQFRTPYRSTLAFCSWLETEALIHPGSQLRILDLCSGAGANTYHMSNRYPNSSFVGVDINPDLVAQGNAFVESHGIRNCRLEVGDIYDLDARYVSEFDGVVFLQTLSWLPEFEGPIRAIARLSPKWIALTSLFYDGQVSCTNEVTEYDDGLKPTRTSFYNVYSLPVVRRFLESNGYHDVVSTPFEMDVDLPKPNQRLMSTYTEKLEDGHRLQLSGPLLMPWYFVAARRQA
jgi:ubiquinone/menaquinone biosynthesis C-methylase UbiE